MTFGHWVRRAFELPPHETARKAYRLGLRRLREFGERRRDRRGETYSPPTEQPLDWPTFFRAPERGALALRATEILALSEHAVRHEFDLLGSGRQRVVRNEPADSSGKWLERIVNRANLEAAQSRWRLVAGDYEPIDWAVDFKSGQRWSESEWSPRLPVFVRPGADIKVPWELARMQHLPWLWAAWGAGDRRGFRTPDTYAREFQNQIVDFIAQNPPRHGVNWMCAMDVAIRAAGWIVTFDLWRRAGVEFDPDWQRAFRASLVDHGRFIAKNLEWDPHVRGNHYLSNVCGLVLLGAFLPQDAETDDWLAFGTAELYRETLLQFFGDGGNFEMSTGYHRLSAEMVATATAVVAALPEARRASLESPRPLDRARFRSEVELPELSKPLWPVPDEQRHRLARMARFSAAVRGRSGSMPVVGDDDSGRFLKVLPPHYRLKVKEARRRFAHLANDDWPACRNGYWVEEGQTDEVQRMIAGLLGEPEVDTFLPPTGWREEALLELASAPLSANGSDGTHFAFPATGFFVCDRELYHAVLRAGPVGQNGNGGHAHNDQLAMTLSVLGEELLVDAGTYVYSADPDARNRYRSTAMHNTLQVEDREQNPWWGGFEGLFRLQDRAEARAERFDGRVFEGQHRGFGEVCSRKIDFDRDRIRGRDRYDELADLRLRFLVGPEIRVWIPGLHGMRRLEADGPVSVEGDAVEFEGRDWRARLGWTGATAQLVQVAVSPAYGCLRRTWQLTISTHGSSIDWEIEIRA